MVGVGGGARSRGVAVAGLLAAFAVPPVALVWIRAAGGDPSVTVTTAILLVPLAALTVGLGLLARKVGSSADDPNADLPRVADALGATTDALEEQFEE